MKNIYLISTDAGGGHRSSANALQELIQKRQLPWKVHVVNFYQDIVESKWDEDSYNNLILKRGWTGIYWPFVVPLFKLKISIFRSTWLARLEKYWRHHQPDVVVSLIPFVNRELHESLRNVFPETPFVTLLCDLIDCPPHYWIEQQEQFVICPTKKAIEQAISFDIQKEKIFRISGLILNPRFYQPITIDRKVERQRLNLDPYLPTGLVMFGGQGSKRMLEIASRLERSQLNLQLIFLCGDNERLSTTLRNTKSRLLRLVETFTDQLPYYLHLADFFIGKPGSLSISSVVQMNLPVITEINSSTMRQERYCGQWIEDHQVGIIVNDFRNIDRAVEELIKPEKLIYYQRNASAIYNNGVFEAVDILTEIL